MAWRGQERFGAEAPPRPRRLEGGALGLVMRVFQTPAGKFSDVTLAALVVLFVGMMIVPLPTLLLDVLLAGNIAVGVLMLLIAIYIPDGLAFAAMPTVLLVTTLFRLSLTISATRLILLQAYAGGVIASFGEFVVQGNYAVGAVVFLILTIVQYVVIARGAERVAEVGARFTLDAMPGRQMAIDADLRAGALTADQAQQRRRVLQRESQFYGAMDGAMKFVKGDAVAGIAITAINLIAGVGIGIGMRKMSAAESMRVYGLLTVGSGLVMQICSLLVSTSAGVVVTRVASENEKSSLGADIGKQLFGNPKLIGIGAVFIAALAVVPGLPALPFLLIASLGAALAWGLANSRARRAPPDEEVKAVGGAAVLTPAVEPLTIELGSALSSKLLGASPGFQAFEEALARTRARFFLDFGVALPTAKTRTSEALEPNAYRLGLQEIFAGQGVIPPGKVLVLTTADRLASLGVEAEAAVDPATGTLAFWVDSIRSEALERGGISSLDGANLIACHLERAASRRPQEFLSLQNVQNALDQLGRTDGALVRGVVPNPISLALLTEVLRRLVEDKVSIRPLREILEALSLSAPSESDPDALAERARARLARYITYRYAKFDTLSVHQLDPDIEEAVRDAIQKGPNGAYLALAPDLARAIIGAIEEVCSRPEAGDPPILLTQSDIRIHLRRLLTNSLFQVVVLSHRDLAPEVRLKPLKQIKLGA